MPSTIVIRLATASDRRTLHALAELDSSRPPEGATLIAELDGQPVAALSLLDGHAVADPFRSTAELVELLRLRGAQLRRRLAPRPSGATRRPTRRRRARFPTAAWR